MATIPEILGHSWPGTEWTIQGDDYNTLQWAAGNGVAKPSEANIRILSEEVDAAINAAAKQERQQRALADAPDYLLRAFETLIDIIIEQYRVTNDIRDTVLPAAHNGNFTAWNPAKLSKAQNLRQKIIDLRNID